MPSGCWQSLRAVIAFALIAMFAVPPSLLAQEHVVTPSDIHKQLLVAAEARNKTLREVNSFFASPTAQHTLKAAGLDISQVKGAVSQLSDEELARLQTQTQKVQHDFAAGSLTNQQLTYIIIALATAVIILVIVAR